MNYSGLRKKTLLVRCFERRSDVASTKMVEIENLKSTLHKEIMKKRGDWFPKFSELMLEVFEDDRICHMLYNPPSYCATKYIELELDIFIKILEADKELYGFTFARCGEGAKGNIYVSW
jgi:hypothetical protein